MALPTTIKTRHISPALFPNISQRHWGGTLIRVIVKLAHVIKTNITTQLLFTLLRLPFVAIIVAISVILIAISIIITIIITVMWVLLRLYFISIGHKCLISTLS